VKNAETLKGSFLIQLRAPLRFQVDGRYTDRFGAEDLARCLHRRTQTLCSQYGGNDFADVSSPLPPSSPGWTIQDRALVWRDFTHYSSRQKKAMRLGGVTGSLVLSGVFSAYEHALLRFAELFHAGKNTNFGLGKMTVGEKN
jgi:hypothetical protein